MTRYEQLLAGRRTSLLHEEGAVLPNELEIQALFFGGVLGETFPTSDNETVHILHLGEWNHSAGPDFLNCRLRLGSRELLGDIELDLKTQHWESHGHATDPRFENVVLHLSIANSCRETFIRDRNHRLIPQATIPLSRIQQVAGQPGASAPVKLGRCSPILAELPLSTSHQWLKEAAHHRARQKAARFLRIEKQHGFSEALWQTLAASLGFHKNQLAMTLLAQRLPIQRLKKQPAHLIEAQLFGHSGFLTSKASEAISTASRNHLRQLWDSWWQQRPSAKLRELPWDLAATRPQNHPQRRIAALATIAQNWQTFERQAKTQPMQFLQTLPKLSHPYWSYHYTFHSRTLPKPIAILGRQRVQDFLLNTLLPLRLTEEPTTYWPTYQELNASNINNRVAKAAHRLFGNHPHKKELLKKAWQQQGLLQLYQDFCLTDQSDCLRCRFPEQLSPLPANQ